MRHLVTMETLVVALLPSSLPIGQSLQHIVFSPLVQLPWFSASTTSLAQTMPMTQTGKSVFPLLSYLLSIRKEVSVSTLVHPDYDSSNANNDIALLKLAQAVDLSIYTPACLPASSADYVGQTAKVYGGKIFLPLTLLQDGAGRTRAASQLHRSCLRPM